MPKQIHLILNASSGLRGKAEMPAMLTAVFQKHGCEAVIHQAAQGTDITALAARLVAEGASVVAAGGGDGTQNAVAAALAESGVAMGVLPVGTLNHFARDLSIPLDAQAAAEIIAEGHTTEVDIAEVNGRRFINNAIIGLYPVYKFQRDYQERRGRTRWLAIASAFAAIIRANPAMQIRLSEPVESTERRTPFLMVANNRHEMEGYSLGTRAHMDEGLLWLYLMDRMSRLALLRLGLGIALGRFTKAHDFQVISAREFVVESRRKSVGVSLDGEVIKLDYPLRYRSLPNALRVIVPRLPSAR